MAIRLIFVYKGKAMSREKKFAIIGKILLLLATIVWGSSFVVLKDALDKFGNGNFTFLVLALRFIVSAVIIFFCVIKKLKTINRSVALKGIILGVILFLAYAVQTLGLKYTTPSKNSFLTVSYCVIVPFLSLIVLKQKPKASHYIAGGLCLLGIAFIAILGKNESAGNTEWIGDILSVCCGLFYALQIIYIAKYASNEDGAILLFFEVLTVAVLCSVVSCSFEIPFHYSEIVFDFEIVWKILYLALFATCFAQFAQMFAQKYASPISVALILSLEGVFGVIFELISGAQVMSLYIWIGFALIFVAQIIGETDPINALKNKFNKNKNNS